MCDSLAGKIHYLGGFSYELRSIRTDEASQPESAIGRAASRDYFCLFRKAPRKYVEQWTPVSENFIKKHDESQVSSPMARTASLRTAAELALAYTT